MKATIDKAGRLVIPKSLRDDAGLRPGEVEVRLDGSGVRIEAIAADSLQRHRGRLRIPPSDTPIGDAEVRALRDAGRR